MSNFLYHYIARLLLGKIFDLDWAWQKCGVSAGELKGVPHMVILFLTIASRHGLLGPGIPCVYEIFGPELMLAKNYKIGKI